MSQARLSTNRVFDTVSKIPFLAVGVLIAMTAGLSPAYAAEKLQLRTDDHEVSGTREIESGKFVAGIEKLEIALEHAVTHRKKAAILNNLCVAYVATSDLDTANTYCQLAVDNGYNLDLAYNNRGVMSTVAGNVEAGIHDFNLAVKFGLGFGIAKQNLALLTD